jgi:hypothetical protein
VSSLCTLDQCQYCENVSVLVVVEDEDMVHTPEKSLVVALEPYKVASAEREAVVRLPARMNETLAWAHRQAMSYLCLPPRGQSPSQEPCAYKQAGRLGESDEEPGSRALMMERGWRNGDLGYGSSDLVGTCR